MGESILYRKFYYNKTITFTIGSKQYQADKGMTWEQWVNSSYNIDGYKVYGGGTIVDKNSSISNTTYVSTQNNTTSSYYVLSNSAIESNGIYYNVTERTGCCFVPGTQVTMTLDGQTKNIEDIKVSDTVVSYNVETGQNYLTEVTKIIINPKSIDMAKVYFDNGTMLEMTDYHPIYTTNGWHSITNVDGYDTLVEGDIAKTINGWSEIIKIELYTLDKYITTYTIDVKDINETIDNDDNDNYYANGICNHNYSTCGY